MQDVLDKLNSLTFKKRCKKFSDTEDFILEILDHPVLKDEFTAHLVTNARSWFNNNDLPYTIITEKNMYVIAKRKIRPKLEE